MTVQPALRMWSRHDASIETQDNRKKKATVLEVYQITCDPTDGIIEVLAADDLPVLGEVYAPGGTITYLICKKRRPKQVSPVFWHVEIVYEGEFGPSQELTDNPLNDPPEKTWTNITSDDPMDEDFNGDPIVTACGEAIEGVTVALSDLQLNVKRNYIGIDLAATHAYLHSVNSDTFAGFAPGVARLTAFSAKEVIAEEHSIGYWEVNATIIFRYPWKTSAAKAWWARLRHEGYYVRRATDDKVVRGIDANKEPVSRPVLLDENGYAVPIAVPPAVQTAHYIEFQRYGQLPYNALGLL